MAGGLNLYGFAGGDPVNFSDPFGLCKDKSGVERGIEFCPGGQGIKDVSLQTFLFFAGILGAARVGVAAGWEALTQRLASSAAETGEKVVAERVSAIGLNRAETEIARRFFRSEGKDLTDVTREMLLKYRSAAEDALAGVGNKRVTETVLRVQNQRIQWIDEALKSLPK